MISLFLVNPTSFLFLTPIPGYDFYTVFNCGKKVDYRFNSELTNLGLDLSTK